MLKLPSLAVDLPGRHGEPGDVRRLRVADCTDHVVDLIEQACLSRIVLVAHSYSGVLAAPIVDKLGAHIAHVVFVGACVPTPGCSVLDTMTPEQRRLTAFGLQLQRLRVPFPRFMVHRTLRRTVCNDMDDETTRLLLNQFVVNDVIALFRERATLRLPSDITCSYIKLTQDRGSLPPSYQDRVIAGLEQANILTLDTGHTAMLSRPRELAALLNTIVARIPDQHSLS